MTIGKCKINNAHCQSNKDCQSNNGTSSGEGPDYGPCIIPDGGLKVESVSGKCCNIDWACSNDDGCYHNGAEGHCSTSGPCPPPKPAPMVPGCESVCTTSSSNLMSTDSTPSIKGISISDNNLIINYGGGAPAPALPKGVNPWPAQYGSKVMWLYACPMAQGLACVPEKYLKDIDGFVTAITHSNVNYISLICNNSFKDPKGLGIIVPTESGGTIGNNYPLGFTPMVNPAMQVQTNILFTKDQLKTLHEAGITIVMSVGSWMSYFPRGTDIKYWDEGDAKGAYKEYVDRFECMRCSLGGALDGLDFDIEGYCNKDGLWNGGCCGWDNNCKGAGGMQCGQKQAEKTPDGTTNLKCGGDIPRCYLLPDQTTVTVLNGLCKEMKKRGYVTSIVPPTNTLFSETMKAYPNYKTENQSDQNQLIKYNCDFSNIDGIMFQFYTGFDAGMCRKPSDNPSKETSEDRYHFCPTTNVEDLSTIDLAYLEGNGIDDSYKSLPYYPNYPNRNPNHCPRYVDCPDWAYKGEKPFQRQTEYFMELVNYPGMSLDKFVFGLEFFYSTSQWGPFPSATLFYGLNKSIEKAAKDQGIKGTQQLGGLGGWTIAGTFGEYAPGSPLSPNPNDASKPPPGLSFCQRSGYKNNAPGDINTIAGTQSNMWCAGQYYGYFEKAVTSCWGAWGKYKGGTGYATKRNQVCTDFKPESSNNYCLDKDGKYPNGIVQCLPPGAQASEPDWPKSLGGNPLS